MTNHETSGFWRRLGRTLQRAVLGKSSSAYMKQFCGAYDYLDNAAPAMPPEPAAAILRRGDVAARPSTGNAVSERSQREERWENEGGGFQ